MTDQERIEALLDIADPERTDDAAKSAQLAVLGLATKGAKGRFQPTVAGWSLLAERGRAFRKDD